MAIVAGLILIPLKYSPPIWKDERRRKLNAKRGRARLSGSRRKSARVELDLNALCR